MPYTPLKLAGWRIDPPVSLPRVNGTISNATATAEPPLLPPATRLVSTAFLVGPKAEFSVLPPCAKASRFTLPIQIAPSASKRSTASACTGEVKASNIWLAAVVGAPNAIKLSFSAKGTPARRPVSFPSSTRRARSSARCSVRLIKILYSRLAFAFSSASLTRCTALRPSVMYSCIVVLLIITTPLVPLLAALLYLAPAAVVLHG